MHLDRLPSARRGASASHTASTPILGERAHGRCPVHFEVIFGAPEGSPNGTENEFQNGAPKGPNTDSQRELKEGSQSRISRCCLPKSSATSHRFLSCHVASDRVALSFDKGHKSFKKQKQGRPEYSLQRTPPLKSFRCIHSGCFSLQLKLTRSHPKDVLFWFFFELWI